MRARPNRYGLAVALPVAILSGVAAPALAPHVGPDAQAPRQCAQSGENLTGTPWQQLALGPERAWPFASGQGVTVAVLGSGVDAGRPELSGRVDPGFDAVVDAGTADDDCLGLGTEVAGVIAARRHDPTDYTGLAPDARVLPVRVISDLGSAGQGVAADVMAAAVRFATEHGAQVIDAAVPSYSDSADLRAAVAQAIAAGVVVVAAVGDLGEQAGGSPTPYPASYPGVLGVGAVDPTAARWPGSAAGAYVRLVAPGFAVVCPQRRSGFVTVNGTGVASGFVAAAAALVRERRPEAGPTDIVRLLLATASPIGGPHSPDFGYGMVNPYGALTIDLVDSNGGKLAGLDPRPPAPLARANGHGPVTVAAVLALVAAMAALVLALVRPAGRRRHWRATLAPRPPAAHDAQEPGPPLLLFEDP